MQLEAIVRRVGNVQRLQVAWTFNSGDAGDRNSTTIENTPLVVDGVVYLTSPNRKLIALDVKPGDKVLFGKYSGQTVKVKGEELLVMREEDIMGVIEGA